MAAYSITYDLHKIKNYTRLQEGIDALSGTVWVKPTLSQFIVKTTYTSSQIRDCLKSYVDHDDTIFVAKIDLNDWASYNVEQKLVDPLKTTFF
ncbi:TPA: hypothetical protein ACHIJP_003225 [Acinetobacter baumannii]|uniref:hypothetical protein n=1 Tax=Acinetobacter baumannii TaxID=470 RepID=UPI001CDC0204|nr:hypothetical protein [Acinetobacter baumannii]MCA4279367.1 hypothetical protein [Acinetobacter baumannii]